MSRRTARLPASIGLGIALVTLMPAQTALTNFGDSLTGGWSVSDAAHRWTSLFAASQGWAVNNLAVGGSEAIDQADLIYGTVVVPGAPYTYMIGTVDQSVHAIDPFYMPVFREAHEAEVAWLALPPAAKLLGKSESVEANGTWRISSGETQPGYNLGVASNTEGDTVQFSLTGNTVYIATIVADGNGGQFDIAIDGLPSGRINCFSPEPIISPSQRSYAPKLLRFAGLSSGTHVIKISVVSTTDAGNVVYFDWAAGLASEALTSEQLPVVYIGDVPRQAQDTTYVWQYSTLVAQNVSDLQADGLNVIYVDDAAYLNPYTDFIADNAHLNDAGSADVAQAFIDSVTRSAEAIGLPTVSPGGILNSLSNQYFVVADGELVSIYGNFLGPPVGISGSFDPVTNLLPTSLAGTSVSVDDFPAALLYVSQHQIDLQIPYGLDTWAAPLAITNPAGKSLYKVALGVLAPGASPQIVNQNGVMNSACAPAQIGDMITAYGTGLGNTNPLSATGLATTPSTSFAPQNFSSVTINGKVAPIEYIGLTPGTAGIVQVTVKVPEGLEGLVTLTWAVNYIRTPPQIPLFLATNDDAVRFSRRREKGPESKFPCTCSVAFQTSCPPDRP